MKNGHLEMKKLENRVLDLVKAACGFERKQEKCVRVRTQYLLTEGLNRANYVSLKNALNILLG